MGRSEHLVRRRRGKNLSRASSVQHAQADKAGMQGLVSRTATGNQRYLARPGRTEAPDKVRLRIVLHNIGMCFGKAEQTFLEHGIYVVDELFHGGASNGPKLPEL
jgi:hypothetical protein